MKLLINRYGAPIERATRDIDFAVQVESWPAFEKIKTMLITQGFSEDGTIKLD